MLVLLLSVSMVVMPVKPLNIQNPVINETVFDPHVFKHGNTYYSVSSMDNIILRKSTDLQNWTYVNELIEENPSWTTTPDYWAPEIHQIDNCWFVLYFGIDNIINVDRSIAAAVSRSVTGPYHVFDRPFLSTAGEHFSDPHLLNHNGNLYLFWVHDFHAIYGQRMQSDGVRVNDSVSPTLILRESFVTNVFKKELSSPYVIYRRKYFYLFYSASEFLQVDSEIIVARSTRPLGPYTINPKHFFGRVGDIISPGKPSLVKDLDNFNYLLVFDTLMSGHKRNYGDRHMCIKPIFWREGWPVVAD